MKKSKIFLATGALALAISAVFATKANKKFRNVTSAAGGAVASYDFKITGQSIFTTSGNQNQRLYARLVTAGVAHTVIGGPFALVTDKAGNVPILLK